MVKQQLSVSEKVPLCFSTISFDCMSSYTFDQKKRNLGDTNKGKGIIAAFNTTSRDQLYFEIVQIF